MPDASQQDPQMKSGAGYRPLAPVDFSRGVGTSAYGYVAGAAGLGLVLGVAMAIASSHGRPAAPQVAESTSVHTSGLAMMPASYLASAPTLLSKVEPRKKAPAVLMTVSAKHMRKHASARRKHGLHKLLDWKKDNRSRKGARRAEYVSPNAVAQTQDQPPVADGPTALQMANAAAASGPFFLVIQGDATVANYDAATGRIQTYEGETYLLAKAGDTNGISWQDYPFNVHYSCDELGSCTLSHGGASATAKLAR
jgi:hypothetical protein